MLNKILKIKNIIYSNGKKKLKIKRHRACLGYLNKIQDTSYGSFFDDNKICSHISFMKGDEGQKISELSIIMLRTRFCRTIEFVGKLTGNDIYDLKSTILDVGDASGLFLEFFHKKGVGLNIEKQSHDHLIKRGFESILSDASELELNRRFDYIFAFEIIEHVQDPIRVLNKLRQITNKIVFVTIPYIGKKTRIRNFGYWDKFGLDRRTLERKSSFYHIFEFSPYDFRKIISHAHLDPVSFEDCFNFFPSDPRFQMWALKPIKF